jgi:hypothetical protein
MGEPAWAPTGIPELDDNPLANRLPPLISQADRYRSLEAIPSCTAAERNAPPHIRAFVVVSRLGKTFIPTGPQVFFAQQLNTVIRAGYDGVSLGDRTYAASLAELSDQVEAGKPLSELASRFESTASCGQLFGPSGMGKTTIIKRVLADIPQVIPHNEPVTVQQIVHLRLECPASGSPKQLCLAFFEAVDKLLGTEYLNKFSGVATDLLVLRLASTAHRHRLGLLVVDEIQFLRSSKIDEDQVLNLLTQLVNVINVPVLLVGTMAAVPLLTKTFRNARRVQGVASAIFQPMKKGAEWDRFLQMLFRLQWTREVTQLDQALSDALWEESQGIVDIVIKLFALAQLRLMRRSEVRPAPEIMKPSLIRRIAKEELQLVRPLLNALRRGTKTIDKYDDLRPLDRHFKDLLGPLCQGDLELPPVPPVQAAVEVAPVGPEDAFGPMAAALASMGFAPDYAAAVVAAAKKEVPSGDPLALLAAVHKIAAPTSATGPEKRGKGRRQSSEPTDPADVRRFAARQGAGSAYEEMVESGLIQALPSLEAA